MKNLIKKILRENDWDFLDDVDPSLGDELNYLLDGSNYYLSVSRQVTLGGSPAMDIISNFGNHELNVKELGGNQIILRFSEPLLPTISDIVEDLEKRLPRQGGERAVMFQEVIELLSKGVVTESEDKDWDFMDIDPLEFVGGEVYVDFKNLSYDQRVEAFNKLENDIGELNIQEGGMDDTKEERIGKCFNLSMNGILLHCGHEDNDYNPKKNDVCCMKSNFEELESETHDYHNGGITYVNGEDLIDTDLNESEDEDGMDWMRDIETPLKDELTYLLRVSNSKELFYVTTGRSNNPRYFDIMRWKRVGQDDLITRVNTKANMGELISELKGSIPYNYEDSDYGEYWIDIYDSIKVLINILENSTLNESEDINESEDKDFDWIENIEVTNYQVFEELLKGTEFNIIVGRFSEKIGTILINVGGTHGLLALSLDKGVDKWIKDVNREIRKGGVGEDLFLKLRRILEKNRDKFE